MLMKEQGVDYKIDYQKYAQQELRQNIPVSEETLNLIASLFLREQIDRTLRMESVRHFFEEVC